MFNSDSPHRYWAANILCWSVKLWFGMNMCLSQIFLCNIFVFFTQNCKMLFTCRTSHRVVLGEHDRASNAEAVQVMGVSRVGDKQHLLLISHQCLPVRLSLIMMSFPARCSSTLATTASPSTTTSCSSSWPALPSWTCVFPQCVWLQLVTTLLEAWSVWPAAGAWPVTTVRVPASSWPIRGEQCGVSRPNQTLPLSFSLSV